MLTNPNDAPIELTFDDLFNAESFLAGHRTGRGGCDPIWAHLTIKLIYTAGATKYPSLWERAHNYVHSYEYASLDRIASLPSR